MSGKMNYNKHAPIKVFKSTPFGFSCATVISKVVDMKKLALNTRKAAIRQAAIKKGVYK